jgi:Secretion system C-terminal sorting domain
MPLNPGDDQSAAGNIFIENLNDIYSLGDDQLIQEFNDDMELNESPEFLYTGWSYYHFSNEDHIPNIVNQDIEVIIGDVGLPYNESTSCASPYEVISDNGGGQHHIMDLDEVTASWLNELELCQEMTSALDDFYTATPVLLNAIYGSITNETELAEFLKSHSPLSNEVLMAYINRANVPIIYLAEVIEMNGELDHELQLLVGQKVEDLPALIASYINHLTINNPVVESVAESKRRIAYLNLARQALLKKQICQLVDIGDHSGAFSLLENENDVTKGTIKYSVLASIGQSASADNALLSIPLHTERLEEFVEDGKQRMLWENFNQPFGLYDSTTTEILLSRLQPDPSNESYTTNKLFWGLTGEFPIYIPKEIPEERFEIRNNRANELPAAEIYPNPCSEYIRVHAQMDEKDNGSIELYDVMGRVVFQSIFNSYNHDPLVKISGIVPGIYTWKINIKNVSLTGKIEVQ